MLRLPARTLRCRPASRASVFARSRSVLQTPLRSSRFCSPSLRLERPTLPSLLRTHEISVSTSLVIRRQYASVQGSAASPAHGDAPPLRRRRPILVLLLVVLFGAAFLLYLWRESRRLKKAASARSAGKPNIGGSWSLVDQNGLPRTEHDFAGKFQLIYFGFTFCPSICPKELQKMADVVRILDAKGFNSSLQPLFVSVDPQRDNIAQIREYLREYHPSMVGLVGTPEQLKRMERFFKVYAASAKEDEADSDYLVDHSVYTYLMGPANQFVDYYSSSLEPDAIAQRVIAEIKSAAPKGPLARAAHEAVAAFKRWLDE